MVNVLYVEDDERSRDVLWMVQRMYPGLMEVIFMEDSHDFEEHLLSLQPQPHLIFLDIHVKPYTGFEMLKIIREHKNYDSTPVVALTASVMNEEVDVLKDAGFQGVFAKPLDLESFPTLVNRIMQGETVWYVW